MSDLSEATFLNTCPFPAQGMKYVSIKLMREKIKVKR
jgi:hypothetical protein